jgi:ribosomal protein L17
MKVEKIFKVKKTRSGMNGSRETVFEGTLEYLKSSVFGYTIECGHSWNHKINPNPKTIKALISSINKSYDETEGGYTRSYVELID